MLTAIHPYINGQRTAGASTEHQNVTSPATGRVTGQVALAGAHDSAW